MHRAGRGPVHSAGRGPVHSAGRGPVHRERGGDPCTEKGAGTRAQCRAGTRAAPTCHRHDMKYNPGSLERTFVQEILFPLRSIPEMSTGALTLSARPVSHSARHVRDLETRSSFRRARCSCHVGGAKTTDESVECHVISGDDGSPLRTKFTEVSAQFSGRFSFLTVCLANGKEPGYRIT